ncbi:G-patch domain and KOW motifs-containing protein-like [Cydia strobilella]|uniref:G-patch domain and KOW motifs-containing protein-like n=1 Tax=Cydia strobilella TaxID=1100964 RepID=UPI003003CBD9
MEGKKISFSFTKTKKVEKPVVAERKEYIECLEEKSIKVVGGEVVEEKAPLVIAMKPNTLITAERLKQIAEEVEKGAEEVPAPGDNGAKGDNQPKNETIDQMAVRELLNEAKKEIKVEGPVLTVAVPSQPVLDGQKESTLEDYDTVPIQEFGMAMLRGMGWTASKDQQLKHKQPELRPKGLGLGADKVIKDNQKKNVSKDKKDEELSIVKNSFVKITTGKYSGLYGKVVSLDEDNGRVMVDITIKKETVSLSEFMMQPVSKSEYDKQSKVINADSYEEYKKNENQKSNRGKREKEDREASSSHREKERDSDRSRKETSRKDKEDSNGRHKQERHRSRSNDRHRKKHKKRYSSNSSISSDERTKKKEKRYSSDSSDSDDHRERRKTEKRDIDKKRKGKKKKRDRDRSPNYRKHRK